MFGYIRPMQGELKVRELERFKACYCGLCHALGKRYGFAARFVLSYELVFLAMLLWGGDEPVVVKRRRCIASPCRRRRYCTANETLGTCAAYCVILAWWKLRDTVADEPFFKAVPHRLLSVVLSGAYKKASREFPGFDAAAREELTALADFEARREGSLDAAADKFARIIQNAAPEGQADAMRRPLLEMLYHLGRWIYIIDACDDYSADVSAGRFNPVASRFPSEGAGIPEEGAQRLKVTLAHSSNLICSAFELLPENAWSEVVRNMIYIGMPDACSRVFSGKWPPQR
jgi:hypothetical protein